MKSIYTQRTENGDTLHRDSLPKYLRVLCGYEEPERPKAPKKPRKKKEVIEDDLVL